MPRVNKRESAKLDLTEHFEYLAEHAGWGIAERFLNNAESSFADLARQPMMGAPIDVRGRKLAGMRKWRVKGFDSHLIFYKPN